jgi:urease accessory protein
MFDAPPTFPHQRVRGSVRVVLSSRGLRVLRQQGSAKAMLPRVHGPDPEVVILNTAGGLTGGDRLDLDVTLESATRATVTTQTAERAYRSVTGAAGVAVRFHVGQGGHLVWLPQETILYDGAALSRRTDIALDRGATALFCEMIVLGRAAHGETLADIALDDLRRVTRDGRPVLVEPLRIDAGTLARGTSAAIFHGARGIATVALVAPGAEAAVDAVRAALPDGARAAVSGWDGKCVVRVLAPGAQDLRRAVAAVAMVLKRGPLPRVWAMGGT